MLSHSGLGTVDDLHLSCIPARAGGGFFMFLTTHVREHRETYVLR